MGVKKGRNGKVERLKHRGVIPKPCVFTSGPRDLASGTTISQILPFASKAVQVRMIPN